MCFYGVLPCWWKERIISINKQSCVSLCSLYLPPAPCWWFQPYNLQSLGCIVKMRSRWSVQWLNKQTDRKISTNWRKWVYRAEMRGLYVEYYNEVIFCGVSQVWDEKHREWDGFGGRKEERQVLMVKSGHRVWSFTTGGCVGSSGWISRQQIQCSAGARQ